MMRRLNVAFDVSCDAQKGDRELEFFVRYRLREFLSYGGLNDSRERIEVKFDSCVVEPKPDPGAMDAAIAAVRKALTNTYPNIAPARNLGALTPLSKAEHVFWMCREVLGFTDNSKIQRWLGFMQGVLWALGLRDIEQMREDNQRL